MSDKKENNKLYSEIIGRRKQLLLQVSQTSDYVYPNEIYRYQIYLKNISGEEIKNVRLQVFCSPNIAIEEDTEVPPEGIEIGDLSNGQSHLLYLKARCSTTGEQTVHFICQGYETGVYTQKLKIYSDYDSYSAETIHRLHVYNFSPYEETYELLSRDFNDDVTQLRKRQKLPYKAKENPFKMISSDLDNNVIIDESQNILDKNKLLYGDPYDTDEHHYQYLDRENFNKSAIESYSGSSLRDIFNQINDNSKLFRAQFLRSGSGELLTDFKEYNPDGFIYRFGLMSSEIFHYVGVLPEYSYMNDLLFRWASEGQLPPNLYPKREDMVWDTKKWVGHGYNVWKTYTDEYKEQIVNNPDYEPLFEFVYTFEDLQTAEEFVDKKYEFDMSNEYYVNIDNELTKIRKYKYIIKENFYDNGVFFVHIPINKIPSNFYLLETEEIEAIIERTKPYGMKALIKYVIDTNFDINMELNSYSKMCPIVPIEIDEFEKIFHYIQPYKYNDVEETICEIENNQPVYKTRKSTKLIPDGTGYYDSIRFKMEPNIVFESPDPTNLCDIDLQPTITSQGYTCETENNLTRLNQLNDLLYQGNFEAISFYLREMPLEKMDKENGDEINNIDGVAYKLWRDCLKDENHHHKWDLTFRRDIGKYYFTNKQNENNIEIGKVDFFAIPLSHYKMIEEGIESGIGFTDSTGKYHGLSAEYEGESSSFRIRYATSLNDVFKIKKEGYANIIGLAYYFVPVTSNGSTLVVFLIKKQDENNNTTYQYFHHITVNTIKDVFSFIRNNHDIGAISSWSNLVQYNRNTNNKVVFNTPQYNDFKTYDPSHILMESDSVWQNISRIDRNEHSYALVQNSEVEDKEVNDIVLHFDNIDVPADAIIKNIKLKTTLETNSYKTIYPAIRLQDNFITNESYYNETSFYPRAIESYPAYNNNKEYYQKEYDLAISNNVSQDIEFNNKKLTENILFDEEMDFSVEYLNNIEDSLNVDNSYWIELSDFTDDDIIFNDIQEIKFCIEGYNEGREVYLSTELRQNNKSVEKKDTLIQSGYFKKYIPLKYYNDFTMEGVSLRFKFKELSSNIKIFDTYLSADFKQKLDIQRDFTYTEFIDIENKKIINIDLINDELAGYILRNGLTVKTEFDDLEAGEFYRIYSMQLDITYQKQNIDFLANLNSYQYQENDSSFIAVNGKLNKNNYMGGMFFNELIMPGVYQDNATLNSENQGIELEDALYQSFVASSDNMTSITIYPNGFVGNPDVNIKIALYDNKGNTPNKLIKEINVNGWSKANNDLKNATIITYDFNVNNLIIGEKYWIKFEVDSPSKNNYYLLKYTDTPINDFKLLMRNNNNYINTFGALKFHVNTLNQFKSFNSFSAIQDEDDFNNCKVFISLNKNIGELEGLKVQRHKEVDIDESIFE